jgi:hypothetical protein
MVQFLRICAIQDSFWFGRQGMTAMRASLMAVFMIAAASLPSAADDNASGTAGIVADQVRSQGFACSEPVAATKDEATSKPDLPVYVLTCGNGSYRVEVIPDQGAKITSLP